MDQNNYIEFDEFLGLIAAFYNDTSPEIKLKEAFDIFDLDSDFFITYQDLKQFLIANNVNTKQNEELIKDMMTYTDLNKDSKIDYNEFSIMYTLTKNVLKQLKQIDLIRSDSQKKCSNSLS